MIDSHVHLYFDRFDDDRDAVIARAHAAGVEAFVNVGIDLPTSQQAIALADEQADMYATIGIHPTSPVADLNADLDALRKLARDRRDVVVAVGEIGLDYYWKEISPEDQKPKLVAQLALARELDLPVVFHCRDALEDLFTILEAEPALPPGVFHCFAGNTSDAKRALELGYHISFAGNVTYSKGKQRTARSVPTDKLLLETDAPFLRPHDLVAPEAGQPKRNEPAFLKETCAFLAELQGIAPQKLAAQTAATTRRLFRLDLDE